MAKILEFPDDYKQLDRASFRIGNGRNVVTAVLVSPRRGPHEGQQMIVLKGSKFGPLSVSRTSDAENVLTRLVHDEVVKRVDDGSHVFTEHVLFTTPSRAAALVLGSNRNGWRVWEHFGSGKSLTDAYKSDGVGSLQITYFEKPARVYEIPALE